MTFKVLRGEEAGDTLWCHCDYDKSDLVGKDTGEHPLIHSLSSKTDRGGEGRAVCSRKRAQHPKGRQEKESRTDSRSCQKTSMAALEGVMVMG